MVAFPGGIEAQAVIFDFDGVIVDTEPLHYKAFQRVLEPLGLGYSWNEYVETYMGFDDRDAFIQAFAIKGRQVSHEDLAKLIASKAEIFQQVIQSGVTSYQGVVELITSLSALNLPLAICSGALRSDIDPILSSLGLASCFDIIVTAEDVVKSKPDPECYRLAFERLCSHWPQVALSPLHTLAIEDTPAGITAASMAGLQIVAVTNSYPREHLANATLVVESLAELIMLKRV